MKDPHAGLREEVFARVLDGPGETERSLRHAAAAGRDLPNDLQQLVGKVQSHAYKVTDADVATPQAVYGDDKMFEIIVSAALGASRKRLMAGLAALDEAMKTQ